MEIKIADSFFFDEICPRCQSARLKSWEELDEEEKEIIKRLPFFSHFSEAEQKHRRYCTFCWFDENEWFKLHQA